MLSPEEIHIKGAREHNLKNVELRIPRGKLVVITGVSGSGKSSLAFDTVYAEGARQYLESLSAKMRANLEQIPRPDVDFIHGLSPVIAIEQRSSANNNPRATVASATEIADYARLLWSVAGTQFCPDDGGEITRRSLDDCLEQLCALPAGTKLILGAPYAQIKRALLADELDNLRRRGFQRIRIDGEIFDLDDALPKFEKKSALALDLIVDRLVVSADARSRLADSLELAFREGKNRAFALVLGGEASREIPLRLDFSCSICGKTYDALTPKSFSESHPDGACPACGGLGEKPKFLPELVVPDPKKSLKDGAIKPWRYGSKKMITQRNAWLRQLAEQVPFSLKTPWEELDAGTRELILHGSGEREFLLKTGRRKPAPRPFEGVLSDLEKTATTTSSLLLRTRLLAFQHSAPCSACGGLRLNPRALAVRLGGKSVGDFFKMSVPAALDFVKNLKNVPAIEPVEDARAGLEKRLRFLDTTGLSYLTLDRAYSTLSGGEVQRVRLAAQLGLGLVGVTYILDEPSIGLHPADHARLIAQMQDLRDRGNSVLVVEHDRDTILAADHVVEIGPGAGTQGGELIFSGTLSECLADGNSRTAKFLNATSEERAREIAAAFPRVEPKQFFAVRGAAENNLKNVDVSFPVGALTVVCGVSGSGKSTLVNGILGNAAARKINRAKSIPGKHAGIDGLENFEGFVRIDQSPIGRSPRSNPATFTGIFDLLRKLYAATPLAKMRGYDAGRFSFNKRGGRCEKCQGEGQIALDMQFLGETWVECPSCRGARYNRETLEVLFKGLNIAEVLDMTISDACTFFRAHPNLHNLLTTLDEVGLGYLKLGQPAPTLSGGEAQRLKLALELSKRKRERTLYLLDEPTTGLHWNDIRLLLNLLFKLRDAGHTLIVIEHNSDVVRCADWLIELGPTGGNDGGHLIFSGTPADLRSRASSTPTAKFL
ncbi:MAG: excinuclease ABC subunit UvrA [Opitutales bacterium]|nr:excinuclease ABC subunit UvrA [Opitutales bacterium]